MSGQQQPFQWRFSSTVKLFTAVLIVAVGARAAVLLVWGNDLHDDRDGYVELATGLADWNGYLHPVSGEPTAFRPPLYPLMLSLILVAGLGTSAIGALHLILGTATVYLTFVLGRRLGMKHGAVIAAGLVAVDPLLLRYAAHTMTETLFTFLVIVLLVLMRGSEKSQPLAEDSADGGSGRVRSMTVGIVFGLCALCRPTIWAFGGLVCLFWCWKRMRNVGVQPLGCGMRERPGATAVSAVRELRTADTAVAPNRTPTAVQLWWVIAGIAATVLPWGVRNAVVLGRPIVTTTHGGYTLLLGNNRVFTREVVNRPWGTVWSGESLKKWQQSLESEMQSEEPAVIGEVERDRWMYRRAMRNIRNEPASFLKACWLRFRRFWNVVPLSPNGDAVPSAIAWLVGGFYAVLTLGLLFSFRHVRRNDVICWLPLVLLIVAFTAVHLIYWSNARMRAPLIPVIALLAARCVERASGKS